MKDLDSLKYPIGKFKWPDNITQSDIDQWILTIERFPQRIKGEVASLSDEALDWKYRPDGWSIRQVIHHCADSHYNSIIRFKLALTEDVPTIKPYNEAEWALLDDSLGPISSSLQLLAGLHSRWVILLNSLNEKTLKATYFHPEHQKTRSLDETIGLYAWHCDHHLAHIVQAKEIKGSF